MLMVSVDSDDLCWFWCSPPILMSIPDAFMPVPKPPPPPIQSPQRKLMHAGVLLHCQGRQRILGGAIWLKGRAIPSFQRAISQPAWLPSALATPNYRYFRLRLPSSVAILVFGCPPLGYPHLRLSSSLVILIFYYSHFWLPSPLVTLILGYPHPRLPSVLASLTFRSLFEIPPTSLSQI